MHGVPGAIVVIRTDGELTPGLRVVPLPAYCKVWFAACEEDQAPKFFSEWLSKLLLPVAAPALRQG